MSLFTPVFNVQTFDHVEPLPLLSSSTMSSSPSSSQVAWPPLPYTTMLSQRHQALSNVPQELAPSSRPSSPQSHTRSTALQNKIEDAVRQGRYAGDLVNLWCTRRRAVAPPREPVDIEPLSSDQYILPDTEEEWFEWENMVQDLRRKGKEKKQQKESQKIRAALVNQEAEIRAASVMNVSEPIRNESPSPLGFSVIKRVPSNAKAKSGNLLATKAIEPRVSVERDVAMADTAHRHALKPSLKPLDIQIDDGVPSEESDIDPQTELAAVDEVASEPTAAAKLTDFSDISAFPPLSFPTTLLTSTPQPARISEPDGSPLADELQEDQYEEVNILVPESQELNTIATGQESVPSVPQSDTVIIPTPPSPPDSSASPQPVRSKMTSVPPRVIARPSNAQKAVSQPPNSPSSKRTFRMLTPTSDDGNSRPPVHQDLHTPDGQQIKKPRILPPHLTSPDSPATPQSQNTPSPFQNIRSLGNAKGLPFPRTPDRDKLPTLMDLLATSRRSAVRPRPPSRKSISPTKPSTSGEGAEDGQGQGGAGMETPKEGPSPARSYFSSPASGSTGTPGSTVHVPDSPMTPLFTQHPSRFLPMGQSTQVPVPSPLGRPPIQSPRQQQQHISSSQSGDILYSGYFRPMGSGSTTQSQSQSQFQSQSSKNNNNHNKAGEQPKSLLSRGSSGSKLMGMTYSSQFDVEGRVDSLREFLDKDVDFAAWVKDVDEADAEDADDDEEEVDEMTGEKMMSSP